MGLRRGMEKASLLMIITLATVSQNLAIVRGQSGVTVLAALNKTFTTDNDSIAFNAPLTGTYAWDFWLTAADTRVLNPSLSILSPYSLNDLSPTPSRRSLEGSLYRYNWTLSTVDAESDGTNVHLGSDLPVTFNPGYNSRRVITPLQIVTPTSNQTITIFFEPHRAFSRFFIRIEYDDKSKDSVSFLSASPMEGVYDKGRNYVEWDVNEPSVKSYKFTARFAITNKVFPDRLFHKPTVIVTAVTDLEDRQLSTGSSVRIVNANGLGNVTYSATGSYTWSYFPRVRNVVVYGESVVSAYLREVPINSINETATSTNGSLNIARRTEGNWFALFNDPVSTLVVGVAVIITTIAVAVISRRRRPPEDKTRVY